MITIQYKNNTINIMYFILIQSMYNIKLLYYIKIIIGLSIV